MTNDPKHVDRFRSRAFEVSLYLENSDGEYRNCSFEGETSSVSRLGLGVRGSPTGQKTSQEMKGWEGRTVRVEFKVIGASVPDLHGTITEVGESEDLRYRWYVGVEFENELDLSRLNRLGRP